MKIHFKNGCMLKIEEPGAGMQIAGSMNEYGIEIRQYNLTDKNDYWVRAILNPAELLFIEFENEKQTGSQLILYDENGERR